MLGVEALESFYLASFFRDCNYNDKLAKFVRELDEEFINFELVDIFSRNLKKQNFNFFFIFCIFKIDLN